MAEIKIPRKVIFFAGFIYSDNDDLREALSEMEKICGKTFLTAGSFAFNHTGYYDSMGSNLKKYFAAYEPLSSRELIANIKIFSNSAENKFKSGGNRRVNIDPGFLSASNVCLASCKEYYHRIYIGNGIYIENEYYWSKGDYVFFDWTYPDYKQKEYLDFFRNLRASYMTKLNG